MEVHCDSENNFKGFQDTQMREAFYAYPIIMLLSYKLLELGIPLYLFLCEDSNGQSEVITRFQWPCVTMLVSEDANMEWMMEAFTKQNSVGENQSCDG